LEETAERQTQFALVKAGSKEALMYALSGYPVLLK